MRQIVLDTETTGIRVEDNHRIIEIGCIEMINRKITQNHFHTYLNPLRPIDAGAQAVHGITSDFLQDKPLFKDIAESFLQFIMGTDLIIHNAPFDLSFLQDELHRAKSSYPLLTTCCNVIDTLPMARQRHVGQRNNLDALCKRYKVDHSKRDYHGALLDAHLLAQVYLAMTGGQSSLFDLPDTASTAPTPSASSTTMAAPSGGRVIHADKIEQKDHAAYLEYLSKKGGCLWTKNE